MLKFYKIIFLLIPTLLFACNRDPRDFESGQEPKEATREREHHRGDFQKAEQIEYSGESSLRLKIEYTGGDLEIERTDKDMLADIELFYESEDEEPIIEYESSSSRPTLRIRSPRMTRDNISLNELQGNQWRIKLSAKVQVDVEIECGAVTGIFDLTGMQVSDLSIEIGAGELDLEFKEPNSENPDIRIDAGAATVDAYGLCHANFRLFKFNGGVGKSHLSFDGDYKQRGTVELNFGVGTNTVLLPRAIGARVWKDGSFLSPLSIRGFDKDGDVYYSKNYDEATGKLDIDVNMGVGHTSVRWIE